MEVNIALENDINKLMDIAVRSEGHWNYDVEYMEIFKGKYNITKEFLIHNKTFILKDNNKYIGFFSISQLKDEGTLEYFYIDKPYICKGYGKVMWDYMIKACELLGINKISWVTSPEAANFYIKMGATIAQEVESIIRRGRIIPKLTYTL